MLTNVSSYYETLTTRIHYDVNFVVTGDTGSYHNDRLRCHQWNQGWYHHIFILFSHQMKATSFMCVGCWKCKTHFFAGSNRHWFQIVPRRQCRISLVKWCILTLKTVMLGGIPPSIQYGHRLWARNLSLPLMTGDKSCGVLICMDIEEYTRICLFRNHSLSSGRMTEFYVRGIAVWCWVESFPEHR